MPGLKMISYKMMKKYWSTPTCGNAMWLSLFYSDAFYFMFCFKKFIVTTVANSSFKLAKAVS